MPKVLSIFILFGIVFFQQVDGIAAEPLVLTLSHIGAPGSLYTLTADEFARRVEKETNGAVHIAVYPNSGLGSDTAVVSKLLTGEVDFSILSTPMSSIADEFGVFEMPFLVRNRDHVRRFRDRLLAGFLRPAAKRKGYFVLGMWELGFRHLINNKLPITGPESLRGLKLRLPNGEWRIKMFKAFGAAPIKMEFKDVYGAIEAGNIEGLESPLDLLYGAKFQNIQKYLTLSYHVYAPGYLIAGQTKYARLPDDVRQTIERIAIEMQDWALAKGEELDAEYLVRFKKVLPVNECDRLAFTLQSLPIYKEYASRSPAAKAELKLIFQADTAMPFYHNPK